MRTSKAIELFLLSRKAKGLSPETIRWYRGILLAFADEFPQLPKSPTDIEKFLIACRAGDERRHGFYRTLRCFYRFLNKRLNIHNPVGILDPPRRSRKEPKPLSPEELNQLLVYQHEPIIKTALLFFADTGSRLREFVKLDIAEVKETPWGYMAKIHGKTGTRYVPISYETYHALMVNLPLKCTPHHFGILIARAFKKAGVKGTAHQLRHSFATLWEGDELVLQQIMRHAHLSTTKQYRHLRMRFIFQQHNRYSPLKMVMGSSKDMFVV